MSPARQHRYCDRDRHGRRGNIACGIEIGTGPGDYERDAARRWTEADAEVRALEQPLSDTILDAQRRLNAVFIDL